MLFGMIIAIPGWFIGSAVSTIVGQYLGGTGDFRDLRVATAWGGVGIVVLSIIAPAINGLQRPGEPSALACLFSAVVLVVLPWTVVLMVAAVAEAHEFSKWRAVVTVVAPMLVLGLLAGIVLLLGRLL